MCIAYLSLATTPQWPLFIAANRDESHHRPTRATAPWPNQPNIIGGLDLVAGGTWFAVQHQGRFALLTNYRDMQTATGLEQSRGQLCKAFLIQNHISAKDYIHQVAQQGPHYQGFNLIVGQWLPEQRKFDCYYFSNRSTHAPIALAPGHYVLSNHLLNTPWPKSRRLLNRLKQQLQHPSGFAIDDIYHILRDQEKATDLELPTTGLDLERERLVSSPFIVSTNYGTRSSSVWTVAENGRSYLHECSYNPQGLETERHSWPLFF